MSYEFEYFGNAEAQVFETSGPTGYGSSAEMTLLFVISADIQPISGEVEDREFSLISKRRMRMFYSGDYDLKSGYFVKADGVMYRVEYAEKRGLGASAVLEEVI